VSRRRARVGRGPQCVPNRRVLGNVVRRVAERFRAQGVLEQRVYSERPLRHEYLLTEKGWELADILLAISAWGDRWTAGEAGPPVLRRHRTCGHLTQAELCCAHCGEPIHASDVDGRTRTRRQARRTLSDRRHDRPDLRLRLPVRLPRRVSRPTAAAKTFSQVG
jgi:HxlR-like helix-turn-helix